MPSQGWRAQGSRISSPLGLSNSRTIMGILIFSGILSLGYIWAVNKIARRPSWGLAGANLFTIAAIGLSFFSFFCIALPALTVQAALTFVLLIVCAALGLKRNAVLR